MSELLTSEIWPHITASVNKKPGRCHVAVAYFGSGAAKLLPLRKGSTLIVDMSERAVRSGQTKPSEIGKLLKAGVDVHTVENLHAKVFVADGLPIVGSTNASHNSAETLVEAVLETQHREIVRSCRDFVRSLRGELVTPEYVKHMQRLYRPPRFPPRKHDSPPASFAPSHSRL